MSFMIFVCLLFFFSQSGVAECTTNEFNLFLVKCTLCRYLLALFPGPAQLFTLALIVVLSPSAPTFN